MRYQKEMAMKRRGFFGAFVALISAPFAFAAKAIKPKPKPYIPSTEPIVGTCSHCGEKIDNVRTVIRCYESWGEKGDKQGNKAGFRMPMEFIHHSPDDHICQKCVNEKFHEFALAIVKDTKPDE